MLHNQNVPPSWIDAIQASDISNFIRGTRVGVVVDTKLCRWTELLPVMIAKHIPVIFIWSGQEHCRNTFATLPHLRPYLPISTDIPLALKHPPTGTDPRIYHLYTGSWHREHPDLSVEDTIPPHGPYQRPGETREAFLARRAAMETTILRRYSKERLAFRDRRLIYATKNMEPHPNSSVYLWTVVNRAFPDKFPTWAQKPYRLPIRTTAVRLLSIALPSDTRIYNATFNEWDMWLPDNADEGQTDSLDNILRESQDDAVRLSVDNILPTQLEEIADSYETDIYQPVTVEHDYVKHWFGLTPSLQRFENVDYAVFRTQVGALLGYTPDQVPQDEAVRASISGWAWAICERKWDSAALEETWDLSEKGQHYIRLPLHHLIRVMERVGVQSFASTLFELTFRNDPEDQPWKLLVGPMGTLYLARHWEVNSSVEAVELLVLCGIYYHTALAIPVDSLAVASSSRESHKPPIRPDGFTPTPRDYADYVKRVRQFTKEPHARAGLAMGGIVWRLLIDCLGDADLSKIFQDASTSGPSGEYSTYGEVAERSGDCKFVDDVLSEDELGMIVGTYRTYTSEWTHYSSYDFVLTLYQSSQIRPRLDLGGRNITTGKFTQYIKTNGLRGTRSGLEIAGRRFSTGLLDRLQRLSGQTFWTDSRRCDGCR